MIASWLLASFAVLLPAAHGQAAEPAEFGVFPPGAIFFGKTLRPGRGIEEAQSLLRDAGHFGLASGLEDLFYRERTETGSSMHSFGETIGMLLNQSKSPWVASALAAVEDWGRGNRPESTRRALQALETGEFAIYPGGKSLQLFRGDTQTWRTLVSERGPVRDLRSEGKVTIQEIDSGPRARFVAMLAPGAGLRSNDEALLRKAVALFRESETSSLRGTSLYRDCFAQSDEDARSIFALEAGALLEEMRAQGQLSPALDPWIRSALRGVKGLRYAVEPLQIRLDLFASADCPLRALFGSGISMTSAPAGPGDRSLGEIGIRLDLGRFLGVLASEPEEDSQSPGLMAPRPFARWLANFDWRASRLWISEADRGVMLVPSKDKALLVAAWKWIAGLSSFVPGKIAKIQSEKDWDRIVWADAEDEEKPPVTLTRFENWLLLGTDAASSDGLIERLRADPGYVEPNRFAGSLTRVQGRELLADLEPIMSAWSGEAIVQVPFAGSPHPMTWLRLDLGVRPDSWRRTQQLWEALREMRPRWHASLGTVFFRDFEPAKSVGEFSVRWAPGKKRAVAATGDRVRLEWKFEWIKELIELPAPDAEAVDSFPGILEASMRQKIKAVRGAAEAALFDLRMEFEPIFEEICRSGPLFRGFLRTASSWGWPWLSLRTRQRMRATASEGGIRLVFDLNREPGLFSVLSTFFDRYRPSSFEARAMARALAVEQAQKTFQASKAQDRNGNGQGEYAMLAELRDAAKTGVPVDRFLSANPQNGQEWTEEGYRFRLLLPRETDEQERRWCLFAFPEMVGPEHHMVFYTDERGFLMAAWQVMPEQMESLNRETFSSLNAAFSALSLAKPAVFREFCMKPETPPEHREVYEYFLPYLPLYGGRLQGR